MQNLISFSGGESSALMLLLLADKYDLHDKDRWQITFANTGKESEETLRFVEAVKAYTKLPIVWLERERSNLRLRSYKIVDYKTASRKGEPFSALIKERGFLPNQSIRYCTQELKVRPIKHYLKTSCGWKNWNMILGFRADERGRLSDANANAKKECYGIKAPLIDWQITKPDVNRFWQEMPFRLNLKSYQGNCTLCFLKGVRKREQIIRDKPSEADWWAEQERLIGATFDKDYSVQEVYRRAFMPTLFPLDESMLAEPNRISCFCTD